MDVQHKQSIVKVDNIWMEDLFEWFLNHVCFSGGDGAAVIVCKNHREVADWFVEWWREKYLPGLKNTSRQIDEFWHPRDEYDDIINFHDSNENFMFADRMIDLFYHDYTFVVTGDCKTMGRSGKVIKAYEG
jgi:hypothetical protein